MPTARLPTILRHLRWLIGTETVNTLSDRQLLERFARLRDEAAFADLVRRHGRLVRGVCWRVLRHEQDAEDTFQATFLVLARKAATFRWQESVGPWLYQVAYRLAMKARVASACRMAREKTCEQQPEALGRDEAWRDVSEVLDHELQRLPHRCRAPLVLCYLDGKTRDEAAQQLGWGLATLKRRLEEGRDLLRERLARRGLGLSAGMLAAYVSQSVASAAVPVGLHYATVKACLGSVTGESALTAGATPQAVALANGMFGRLARAQVRSLTAVLLAVSLVSTGAGIFWHTTHASADRCDAEHPFAFAEALPEAPALDPGNDQLPPNALARVGVSRARHVGRVSSVAFAPGGKRIASASEDTTIRLWDTATGRQVLQLRGHRDGARAIAFAPDGKVLASGSYDGTVRLWDSATGVELRRFTVGYFVDAIAFHPDGRRLVVAGSFEKRLILWDTAAGKEIRRFGGEQDVVSSVAISPDGKLLASAGDDRLVRLWDIETGQERAQLAGHQDRPWVVAFAPDGKTLASAGKDRVLRLWEVPSGKSIRQFAGHASEIWSVAYSPDGSRLVSGGEDRTVRLWDVKTGEEISQLNRNDREVTSVTFSPDGSLIAAGSHDRSVCAWDAVSGKELTQFNRDPLSASTLAVAPDSKSLATGGYGGPWLWDLATGKALRQLTGVDGWVGSVGFTADGTSLVTRGADQRFRLWDLKSGKPLHSLGKAGEASSCWAFSPAGLLAVRSGELECVLWDVATGKQGPGLTRAETPIRALALSGDGRWVTLGEARGLRILEVATGKEVRFFPIETNRWVHHLSLSPNGKYLAVVITDNIQSDLGPLYLYEVATGKKVQSFGDEPVETATFSVDGRSLIWTSHDQLIRLGEVATGKLRQRYPGHLDLVSSLAFAPDGKTFASSSEDTTILIWNAPGALAGDQLTLAPKLWEDLASDDAEVSNRAISLLLSKPEQTVAFLRKRLSPADGHRVPQLLKDLDHPTFAVREQATQQLEELGLAAETQLRAALSQQVSLELRQRLQGLVGRLTDWVPAGGILRATRAIEVLERVATPEARALLETLATGTANAPVTREAKESLERLKNRPAIKP